MKLKSFHHYSDKIFISLLIIIFFCYNFSRISYGLPFFLNLDENRFLYSTLSYLSFITGLFGFGDPIIAPLLSLILILKSIFISEFLINSLTINEIISKIYFNTELFTFYGRVASLITASLSIFILYLIFKKLKIKLLIYSFLLITFSTSLIVYNIAAYHGKHAYYLLLFLLQLYFFLKYSIKIKKLNINSYIFLGFLSALAWGVSYWPALFSIYFILILHFKKFKFTQIRYLITFFLFFLIFGPILGLIFSEVPILSFVATSEQLADLETNIFIKDTVNDFLEGLRMIFFAEKNLLLLIVFLPLYLLNKHSNFKVESLVILLVFFYPIILFAISQKASPQLRYFVGNTCIILVVTSIIFNEIYKTKFKYLCFIFMISNSYLIYNNISLNNKIDDLISKDHSFFDFNKKIKEDKNRILYLVNLKFQESLKQNQLYLSLYNNNLIKESEDYELKIKRIKNKINKIKNTKNIIIDNQDLKKNITYYNYSFHEMNDLKLFFEFIKKDFDYVVIEEGRPFYLTNNKKHREINEYVKNNFLLEKIYTEKNKIFLRSQTSIIHYYANAINSYDLNTEKINNLYYVENIYEREQDIIYGNNFSLYKITN